MPSNFIQILTKIDERLHRHQRHLMDLRKLDQLDEEDEGTFYLFPLISIFFGDNLFIKISFNFWPGKHSGNFTFQKDILVVALLQNTGRASNFS